MGNTRLSFEIVSVKNVVKFLKLSISNNQKQFLRTSNIKTLYQSIIWSAYSKLFLILDGEQAIGYTFLYCHPRTNKFDIGRLLIDQNHQNHGFGKQVVQWSLDYLYGNGAPYVLLSVHPNNAVARKLYESIGFSYCEGRYWGKEMVMKHMKNPSLTNCN